MTTLFVRDGDTFRKALDSEVFATAHALISRRYRAGAPVLDSPERTHEYLRLRLGHLEYEVFGILHLDVRHRLIAIEDLFRGSLSGATVHPREVVRSALAHNADAIVLFHNHPSGVSEPSAPDQLITVRVKEALALVDIRVVDHIIVAEPLFSFASHGLL